MNTIFFITISLVLLFSFPTYSEDDNLSVLHELIKTSPKENSQSLKIFIPGKGWLTIGGDKSNLDKSSSCNINGGGWEKKTDSAVSSKKGELEGLGIPKSLEIPKGSAEEYPEENMEKDGSSIPSSSGNNLIDSKVSINGNSDKLGRAGGEEKSNSGKNGSCKSGGGGWGGKGNSAVGSKKSGKGEDSKGLEKSKSSETPKGVLGKHPDKNTEEETSTAQGSSSLPPNLGSGSSGEVSVIEDSEKEKISFEENSKHSSGEVSVLGDSAKDDSITIKEYEKVLILKEGKPYTLGEILKEKKLKEEKKETLYKNNKEKELINNILGNQEIKNLLNNSKYLNETKEKSNNQWIIKKIKNFNMLYIIIGILFSSALLGSLIYSVFKYNFLKKSYKYLKIKIRNLIYIIFKYDFLKRCYIYITQFISTKFSSIKKIFSIIRNNVKKGDNNLGINLIKLYQISGKVIDRTKLFPLNKVSITLFQSDKELLNTETDLTGNFIINEVPNGVYSLKFHIEGYISFTIDNITIPHKGEYLNLNISLVSLKLAIIKECENTIQKLPYEEVKNYSITPREILKIIKPSFNKYIKALTYFYEKALYSNQKLDEKIYNEVKKICNNLILSPKE